MKISVNGLSRMNTAEERISKLEDGSLEITQTDIQREKKWRKQNIVSKSCDIISNDLTHI